MFSHFRPYFCLVCVFFLSYWANSLNSSISWRCLSTSQSLIRIMKHLARSRFSFSKTEQNSNRCERAKLRGVWVSLDPNTPLTISLCSINWTGYGVAPTNGRLSVYKWKANWGQDSLAVMCSTYLILQVPHSIPVSEFLKCCATFWKNAAFKATHVKQQIWIVFTVNRHKTFIPVECCHRSWQAVLYVPEHSTPKIDVVFHEPHTCIPWPAFPVVVAHDVFVIWVRVFRQVTLDQITGFICCKPEIQSKVAVITGKIGFCNPNFEASDITKKYSKVTLKL